MEDFRNRIKERAKICNVELTAEQIPMKHVNEMLEKQRIKYKMENLWEISK